ncbi:hypothetical protein [Streptomyces sp. NPDC056492]|uniref:hypothetical protein n=1 Tax=unclassified Streptomyces TaxID=2593676 RepID=UPI0036CEAE22
MNDQDEELPDRVRAALAQAGFEEIPTGSEAVHLTRHARGVMVGCLPEELTQTHRRRGPPHRPSPGNQRTTTLSNHGAPSVAQAGAGALPVPGSRCAARYP